LRVRHFIIDELFPKSINDYYVYVYLATILTFLSLFIHFFQVFLLLALLIGKDNGYINTP